MLDPKDFIEILKKNEITFFTGVPDSLLRDICAYITDHAKAENHVIAANEGNAIAVAAGHYLATGKIPVVYMQNSGLGNAVNPLTSLASRDVYGIPILLLIGWRAEPGIPDEPQHKQMGRIQNKLLETLEIPYSILDSSLTRTNSTIEKACAHFKTTSSPYAVLVPKGIFQEYALKSKTEQKHELSREQAIEMLLPFIQENDVVVSTTGKTSRELFELREQRGERHDQDFLCVGNMGHTSSLALGVALGRKKGRVWCLDGDGSFIMHMGSAGIIGQQQPKNLIHIVLNNFAHDSVGGQPTASSTMDLPTIAQACGYAKAYSAKTKDEITTILQTMKKETGPIFLEILCSRGSRKDLGRPTNSPQENKRLFMQKLKIND